MVFCKISRKSLFHCQNYWTGHDPAGQFKRLESALKLDLFTEIVKSLKKENL